MKKLFVLSMMCAAAACGQAPKQTMNIDAEGRLPRAEAAEMIDLTPFEAAFRADSMDIHSIMVVRHGKVVAEQWWSAGAPDSLHIMNSVSKSFTASAVGFGVAEGLLSLDDRVAGFFPDMVPAERDPRLDSMTVRHLLIMATGQEREQPGAMDSWIAEFLAQPLVNAPGTTFNYNSFATYMLSAIMQKVSGQKITEYLQTRLFDPLAIKRYNWLESPEGIPLGGWGLYITTEDMAKFGQLFLQNGVWNGVQLLPAGWVEEASTWKIANGDNPDSDWNQGYAYQMWRCRHNAYRADGMGGQLIVVMPDKDAVVVVTAQLGDMQPEINLVWEHILTALK